jgi:uncharacterized protein YgiM (DUF1202 family)
MRRLFVAASLMAALAAPAAFGDVNVSPPVPQGAAYSPQGPQATNVDSGTMTVIADKTAVTEKPDSKTKVVGVLKTGEQVTVFDMTEKWAHIHSKTSNLDGYVQKSALQ